MHFILTSRLADRALKREVTVSRPSRVSKVRVLRGVERRAATRVCSVEEWIAGQSVGSRRSRRSWSGGGRLAGARYAGDQGRWSSGPHCHVMEFGETGLKETASYIHVDFASEKGAGGWVHEQDAL